MLSVRPAVPLSTPDCVVCAVPHLDGLQLAGEIRKLEAQHGLPHVPIVAITANAMSQDKDKCEAADMIFLTKPFSFDGLCQVLDPILLSTKQRTAATTQAPLVEPA